MGSNDKIRLFVIALVVFFIPTPKILVWGFTGPVLGGKPQAGFVIKDTPVVHYNKGVLVPKPSGIKIRKIHGFEINPVYAIEKGHAGETVVFAHKFDNLGNTSEKLTFKVISAPPEATVKIMVGKETISGDFTAPEDASFTLWVLCKLPESALPDKNYTFKLLISSLEKDGDAYLGFDGRLHGGKDEITLTDRILL